MPSKPFQVVQVAAFELGIPLSMIRVRPTESVTNSNSASTGGSITSELCCQVRIIFDVAC